MESINKPRVKAALTPTYLNTVAIVHEHKLHTVCEEAACPNISECWGKKHATFMILGDVCTRTCKFCHIKKGKPQKVDADEPRRVAEAIAKMQLRHVVITSVDRDDLEDGGATHFAEVIEKIRWISPETTIEILTPDFLRKPSAIDIIVKARPDVFNHNLETIPRLYKSIRPGARYFNSLWLLSEIKRRDPSIFTKSGIMVGLGETPDEVYQVMDDLRVANVDFMTIGQYLRPSEKQTEVVDYVSEEQFNKYKQMGYGKGFSMMASSPLTRSSYHADEDFARLRASIV